MKIKKIKSEGQYVYPATIAAAVKDANILDSSGKPMSQGEINTQQEEINKKQEDVNKQQEDVNKQQETINVQQNGVISRLILTDYTDLSFKDIFGDDLLTQSTANCYVVKTPGKYKLPLVYGNAIVNGQVNSKAYTNLEPDNPGFMNFVNAYEYQITSPYIEEDIKDIGKKCGSAQFTIGDADIFSDVGTQDGYLYFTLTSVPIGGANGVLSVMDSDGFIVWNWHIWVFPYDLTPETVTNSSNISYDILPAYLATTYDDGDSLKRKNWFYQWGRSVPLPGASAYNSNTTISTYGERNFSTYENYSQPYQLGISSPTEFFTGSQPAVYGRWFGDLSTVPNNLWNSSVNEHAPIKTIYDPSPIGFIVSLPEIFHGLHALGAFNYGVYSKRNTEDTTGMFLPASGYIDFVYGTLQSVGLKSKIHSSTVSNCWEIASTSNGMFEIVNSLIAYGRSVLCMKDPNVELEKGKHSITTIVEKQNTLAKQQEKNTKYIKKKKQTDVDRVVVRKCIPMGAQVGMKYLFDDGYIRFKVTQKNFEDGFQITTSSNYKYCAGRHDIYDAGGVSALPEGTILNKNTITRLFPEIYKGAHYNSSLKILIPTPAPVVVTIDGDLTESLGNISYDDVFSGYIPTSQKYKIEFIPEGTENAQGRATVTRVPINFYPEYRLYKQDELKALGLKFECFLPQRKHCSHARPFAKSAGYHQVTVWRRIIDIVSYFNEFAPNRSAGRVFKIRPNKYSPFKKYYVLCILRTDGYRLYYLKQK